MSTLSDGQADQQFASLIDRMLQVHSEMDDLKEFLREIYGEAKAVGYDKTAMGKLVAELRKRTKDAAKADEAEATLDLYREVYHRASHTGAHIREVA